MGYVWFCYLLFLADLATPPSNETCPLFFYQEIKLLKAVIANVNLSACVLSHSSHRNEHYLFSANYAQESALHPSSSQRTWRNFGFRHSVIYSIVIFKVKKHCAQNTNSLSRPTDAVFDRAVRNILLTFDLYKYSLWHFERVLFVPFYRDCSDPPPPWSHVSFWFCDHSLPNFPQEESLRTHRDHFSVFFSKSPKFPNRLIYIASNWWLKPINNHNLKDQQSYIPLHFLGYTISTFNSFPGISLVKCPKFQPFSSAKPRFQIVCFVEKM